MIKSIAFTALFVLSISLSANADTIVTPQIAGGYGVTGEGMEMLDVSLDSNNNIVVETPYETPVLRPLPAGYAFSPSAVWYSALNGKAYNYQYGWSAGDNLDSLPTGSVIWIKRLNETPGLQTYNGNPLLGGDYSEILATDGVIWKYGDTVSGFPDMAHNTYAVLNPTQVYTANYEVYVGDETGTPLAGYGSADVTWTWDATPVSVPEPSTIVLGGMALAAAVVFRRLRRSKSSA
jgi:hypothetical protein